MTVEQKEAVAAAHKHARKCKKPLADCATCQRNMAAFQRMDLETLSDALADKPTRR